jgi:hypothetical protein
MRKLFFYSIILCLSITACQFNSGKSASEKDYRFLPTWNSTNTLIEIVDASTLNAYFAPIKSKVESLRAVASDDNCVLVLYFLKP